MWDDFSRQYRQIFRGSCFGVGLYARGPNDPHVCFTNLSEDDEHWWDMDSICLSSSWIVDYLQLVEEVRTWIQNNCDPDMYEGVQYGWKFRN